MTSVAKTNQNINFDPTNFNKRFESKDNSRITKINTAAFITPYPVTYSSNQTPFNIKKFNSNFESNDNSFSQPNSFTQPVQYSSNNNLIKQTLLDIKNLLMNIINLISQAKNPIPYIFSSSNNIFSFSLFLISLGCLLLLASCLFK